MIRVKVVGDNLEVEVPYSDLHLAKRIPQRRWVPSKKVWLCRPSLANMQYIASAWKDALWDDSALAMYRKAEELKEERGRVADRSADVNGLQAEIGAGLFRRPPPWGHQVKALATGRPLPYFAYLLDQGTGKTRVLLDDAAYHWRRKEIDAVIIFNKNSVKTNWVADDDDAVATWLPYDVPHRKAAWFSDANSAQKRAWSSAIACDTEHLVVLSVNYEATLLDRCFDQLAEFCKRRRVMIVCDEATMIGTPGSERTRAISKLRKLCPFARILTGTPIVKSPLKAYSQFGFLHEDILGHGSFYSFKARYCIMGGFENRQVVKYVNTDELSEKIAACSFRVTKDECLDLPPKIYVRRNVYMTQKQMVAYRDMQEHLLANIDGDEVSAMIKLTQVMRLQQITGGYATTDDKKIVEIVAPENNPLIKETLGLIEEAGDQKVLVWAHFRAEIAALAAVLRKEGYRVAEFHGGVAENERLEVRRAFARGEYDVLVGNQAAGGLGIDEFKIASVVVYYSNSYDTEARIQSEDRTHRGGSEIHKKITYYDLVVPNTVRVKLIQTLRANKSVSDEIMRDGIREWI